MVFLRPEVKLLPYCGVHLYVWIQERSHVCSECRSLIQTCRETERVLLTHHVLNHFCNSSKGPKGACCKAKRVSPSYLLS